MSREKISLGVKASEGGLVEASVGGRRPFFGDKETSGFSGSKSEMKLLMLPVPERLLPPPERLLPPTLELLWFLRFRLFRSQFSGTDSSCSEGVPKPSCCDEGALQPTLLIGLTSGVSTSSASRGVLLAFSGGSRMPSLEPRLGVESLKGEMPPFRRGALGTKGRSFKELPSSDVRVLSSRTRSEVDELRNVGVE